MIAECDRKIGTPMVLGLIALACWACCPVVVLIGYPSDLVSLIVSWALACCLFGVITSVLCIGKVGAKLVLAALALNVLPPLALAGSFMWLLSRLDS